MNTSFEGRTDKGKDEWLTPPELIKSLGEFDLDVCSPIIRPWDTAKKHFTVEDNGLTKEWQGRVWCNPPYETKTATAFLEKMAKHGNGTVLIFARTETVLFQNLVFGKATALLFIKGRLSFYHASGLKAKNSAGAPSVLIAYGDNDANVLKHSGIKGAFIAL